MIINIESYGTPEVIKSIALPGTLSTEFIVSTINDVLCIIMTNVDPLRVNLWG